MFCGAGGFDLGFLGGFQLWDEVYEARPFDIVGAYDNDARAIETYRLNLSDEGACIDLTEIAAGSLPGADVLIGGFPCQDFSSCGPKVGFEGRRGRLYRVMTDYLSSHRPLVAVAENVPHLARMRRGSLLREVVSEFDAVGYRTEVWMLYGPDFGLPQSRTRVFIVSVRDDIEGLVPTPEPWCVERHRSIDWAIDDLKNIEDETVANQSQYFVATKATAGAGQGDQVSRRGEVAYTVRANARARVHFHYELERRLTVRECARLQAFPDDFVFPFAAMTNMLQIGNAVPPLLGHHVGVAISRFLAGERRCEAAQPAVLQPEFSAPETLFDASDVAA